MLGATAICLTQVERLGFGSVLGFISGGIVSGPHTPGFAASQHVDDLQNVAELGVVFFSLTAGLQMLPRKVWARRRLLFGLGSAQMRGDRRAMKCDRRRFNSNDHPLS